MRRVDAELEDVVAHDLRIVAAEIARDGRVVFVPLHALVGLHGNVAAETTRRPRRVADLAREAAVVVRELLGALARGRHVAPRLAVAAQGFRVPRLGVVARMRGVDHVGGLRNFPARIGTHARALEETLALPDEARSPRGVARAEINTRELARLARDGVRDFQRAFRAVFEIELIAVARRDEPRALADGAVAVDALNGRGRARFAVEIAVAVDVREEMAVHALHAFGEVNVLEMHRVLPLLRIVRGDHGVVEVEHVALFVLLENGAENPAVAVVIGELRLLQLRVQLGDFFEELEFTPQPARGGGLGVILDRADEFGVGGILLFQKRLARFRAAEMRVVRERIFRMRIHELAVALLVPPRVTEIRIHEEIPLVHVAIHALRARDRAGERVLDRVAALVFANRGIAAEAQALIAEFGIPTGVRWRAVVRVHDVARGAAARTVIARMIVAAHEIEERIVQAHLLQIQHDGIGAVQRAEAAFAQAARGFAGRFADGRDAELELLFTAALEDAEQVARLRDVPLRQRIEERQHAEFARVLGRDGRRRVQA